MATAAVQFHPRGRVKWAGIQLGKAIAASSDILTEPIPVDDLTEENLMRALTIPTDGSGGAPEEEAERFDTKSDDSSTAIAASRNASYHFGSHVRDGIKGGQLHREETRNGHKVSGSYSYSDGFVLRMVEYEADENGYRVLKWVLSSIIWHTIKRSELPTEHVRRLYLNRDTIKRIGNGPKENEAGVANIQTEAHGRKHRYTVRGTDMTGPSMPGTEIARIVSKRLPLL